jgi:hypothetical protein
MSKVDPIQITSISLKCDAEGCDYRESSIELSPKHIGKLCPKCGADLLTEADYKEALVWLGTIAAINGGIGPVEEKKSGTEIRASINPRAPPAA